MTLAKGDHLVKVDKAIQALLDSEDTTVGTGEGHRLFEVLDTSYLTVPAPDCKPMQMVLLKVIK